MRSSTSTIHRPLAAGVVATLLAASAISAWAAPAEAADQSPLAGVTLPVPATDVSESDSDLGSSALEVVVAITTAEGPELTKLRAHTAADARTLVAELNALPGVTAALNTTVTLPKAPAVDADTVGETIDLGKEGAASPGASHILSAAKIAGEQYGTRQWGLYAVGAEGAWGVTSGKGITVAVVDSGVDRAHPDFKSRLAPQVDVVPDGLTNDVLGHGTHVAGIIGASLNRTGVVGLANQVTILPIRVFGPAGTADDFTVASGIYAAIDGGAQVINLSLGGPSASPLQQEAIASALAKGITVVASGGNSYQQGNPPNYPAAYPGVLGVSSLSPEGRWSSFANTGSFIDLTAPGEEIFSTVPGGYDWKNGTSMAAPFVSAAAALVRVANPTWKGAAVTNALTSTAMDDDSHNGKDQVFGYGLLQADAAVTKAARATGGIRPPTARVSRAGYGNVLSVNVNPDRGSASYAFSVQKLSGGRWSDVTGLYRTQGNGETRSITLSKGTYRVSVRAGQGYAAAVSNAVTLTDKTVKVAAGRDSAKSQLKVNVDPNQGSGYWKFQLQKRTTSGTWSAKKVYLTQGSGETRTINLTKGTYRVVVAGNHGYKGAASAPVTLVK